MLGRLVINVGDEVNASVSERCNTELLNFWGIRPMGRFKSLVDV